MPSIFSVAPLSYTDRVIGGSSPCMTAAESVHASGVLWLNEDDCRTCFAGTSLLGGVDTLEESLEILRRSRGQALVRGFADWWLDIRDMGWHDASEMWDIQHLLNSVEPMRLEQPEPFSPDILAIVDEDGMLHLSGQSAHLSRPLVYESRAAFGRCGAPYGQARPRRCSDRPPCRAPPGFSRMLWAPTLAATRGAEEYARRGNHARLVPCAGTHRFRWLFARWDSRPDLVHGRAGGHRDSRRHPRPKRAARSVSPMRGVPAARIDPLFRVVAEPGDAIWATFEDGSPAVVVSERRFRRGGIRRRPGPDARVAARPRPNCRRAISSQESDAALWAHGNVLCLHAMADGPLPVSIPEAGEVTDVYRGTALGNGPEVTLDTRKGETYLLTWD